VSFVSQFGASVARWPIAPGTFQMTVVAHYRGRVFIDARFVVNCRQLMSFQSKRT
jgi:hypothetical protein